MSIIEEFVKYLGINRGLSEGTVREYRKDLRETQTWMVTNAKVERWSQVTKENIEDYVADMSLTGLKPATIRRRVSCLRTFYQYAWQKGLQKENPAKYVSTPKVGESVPRTLAQTEIQAAISDTSIDAMTRTMLTVMSETGIRISELRNIKAWDINQDEHTIRVHGKGNKERTVYYGAGTAETFRHLHVPGDTVIFPLSDIEARSRIFWALRKHTGAERCSSHTLRHTWATSMLNAGADLKTIATIMGHASVTTTEKYAKVAGVKVAADYKLYSPTYHG
ncbi:tyrosine-type recombinase/integrase [Exiguobacterium indicum]|uniref:tyrosine-type recombinase/integrase n=1 Tax=Exiguobacterium indicum TaxID=296995 RepID=UPI0033146BD7